MALVFTAIVRSQFRQQSSSQYPESSDTEKLYSAVMSGLTAHIALLDRTGAIVAVNEAWTRFARENNATSELAIGVGVNYLEVCRKSAPDCDSAARCLGGIKCDAIRY